MQLSPYPKVINGEGSSLGVEITCTDFEEGMERDICKCWVLGKEV